MDTNKLKTIEKIIHDKSEAQLKGLIADLCKKFPDSYEYILMWNKDIGGTDINEKLALEFWRKAEKIIKSFNDYGGGSDYEEEESYDYIEKICELFPVLPWKTRQKIMDDMLIQYHCGNSGFDDALTDACFQMCQERDEWLYLAEKLLGYGRDWDKKLVMSIYKTIGDNNAFLELRNKNLHYGNDYFELVEHFTEQDDITTALSYAHKGLEIGNGAISYLVSYLFDYYENKKDTDELEKIMQTCENRKSECLFVSGRLYEYYKNNGDYESAKKYILKEFDYARSSGLDKQYEKIKDYLNEADWKNAENKLFVALKKRDITGYMNICLQKGLKQEVYDIIAANTSTWNDYDFYADKLKNDFPEKIIEYYVKRALNHVENGANRKSYITSMKYFKKAKEIYLEILKDEPRWKSKLAEIRERYNKRKAFMEESRVLD